MLYTVPKFPRNELSSPQQLLQFSRSQQWKQRLHGLEFPLGGAVPIADGIRHPDSHRIAYWFTEVNRFGLIYTQVGFTPTPGDQKEAINCASVARLLVAGLRFSINMYENMLGYYGLLDFHFSVSPTQNRYPFVSELETYWDSRSLDDHITVEFSSSVKEIRDSLAERAKQSYQEFLWAFGLNADNAAASNHFRLLVIEKLSGVPGHPRRGLTTGLPSPISIRIRAGTAGRSASPLARASDVPHASRLLRQARRLQ